jgi:hypothetical protein
MIYYVVEIPTDEGWRIEEGYETPVFTSLDEAREYAYICYRDLGRQYRIASYTRTEVNV